MSSCPPRRPDALTPLIRFFRSPARPPALRVLPDEQLLPLLGALPADLLARLATTSRALYAFAMEPALWKARGRGSLSG